MRIEHMTALTTIENTGRNMTRAAAKLGVSQPSLSKQIIQLENELGHKVYLRNGKRLTQLTPAGEICNAAFSTILRILTVLPPQLEAAEARDTFD